MQYGISNSQTDTLLIYDLAAFTFMSQLPDGAYYGACNVDDGEGYIYSCVGQTASIFVFSFGDICENIACEYNGAYSGRHKTEHPTHFLHIGTHYYDT